MSDNWRFKDEWILKALAGSPGADGASIAALRAEKRPSLADALAGGGKISPEEIGRLVERVYKIPYFPPKPENVDKFSLNLLGEKNCRKYVLLPVGANDSEIKVVTSSPLDMTVQGDIEALAGRRAVTLYALPHDIEACMEQVFNPDKVIFDLLAKVEQPEEVAMLGGGRQKSEDDAVPPPVILLANSIISNAYRKRSSDIHIEHGERSSSVRFRVDGELKTVMSLPRALASGPLVSRIKIMADLDVSNHMRPQDGKTKLRIGSAEVGLRVSTLPTAYGEKVVMRILDQRAAEVPFEKLGFSPEVAAALDAAIGAPQGIVLVTGPTGSGKTTTLYSVLNKTRSESTNIVTVEDPIEYKLAGINQVQVNERQGLTFSGVLRSVLRQDPDVIMVGEIRDRETADIAFQAAMTGHLVFSTLHTNDTVSAVSRLVDMGVDRFKISPGLLAVTAQRLVRRLCPACAEQVPQGEVNRDLLAAMASYGFKQALFRGVGCKNCEGTGYAGRTSIVEVLTVTPHVRDLINSGATDAELARTASADKALRTMTCDALWALSEGRTDLAEAAPYISLAGQADAGARRGPETSAAPAALAPEAAPAPSLPAAAQAAGKRPRVLVADDDKILRMLMRKFIESAGYEAAEAPDGEAALAAIAESEPDLLVTDLHMPHLDGYGLVKGVRETLGLADLPIIMLTTEGSDQSQEMAFKLGVDDYIIKPFKGPVVMARVTAALRRSGRLPGGGGNAG